MNYQINDPYFKVVLIEHTPNPNALMWRAMHQDYSHNVVHDIKLLDESECGKILVKRLLNGHRGHYGVLEHPQLSFNVCYYPHTVMQQLRTHRVGITFDVQSFRYTGNHICDKEKELESLFYLRPVGIYTSREGKEYPYSLERREDLEVLEHLRRIYSTKISLGFSHEHARELIPFCIRQHFVVSCNLRTLLHLASLRIKADVEAETRDCVYRMWQAARPLFPEIAEWYERYCMGKARLAP